MMPVRNHGFSMLVARVIFLVTLMGAAGLVVRTVQQEVEAYQRLQALTLVQDITDRLYSNRQVVACYSNGVNGIQAGTCVVKSNLPACASGSATQKARADADIDDWHDRYCRICDG